MQKIKNTSKTLMITASLLLLAGCSALQSIGEITIVDSAPKPTITKPEKSSSVSIKAYLTGWVLAPADILIDQDNPLTPKEYRDAKWVPSIAYSVTHANFGTVILDAGLKAGDCSYGQRPIYWVECKNSLDSSLVSQLKAEGLDKDDIRYIVPSHFHGDHISGLSSLLAHAKKPLLVTKAGLSEIQSTWRFASGISNEMLQLDMDVELIDSSWQKDTLLGRSMDIFGDGSLKLFESPGHSDGHLSALIRTEAKAIVLTFDAVHLAVNYELNIPSGSVASNASAQRSIAAIKKIEDTLGDVQIIFGHEPAQWTCDDPAIILTTCLPRP